MRRPRPRILQKQIEDTISTLKNGKAFFDVQGKLIRLPRTGRAIIVGDLHGDLDSLKTILKKNQFEQKAQKGEDVLLICLGDYLDRGPNQIEVLSTLMELLVTFPDKVILLRGNHEGPQDLRRARA